MRASNYDKYPAVTVPDSAGECVLGWEEIAGCLREAMAARTGVQAVIAVECYPGVNEEQILAALVPRLKPTLTMRSHEAMLPAGQIDDLVAPFLGGDDPVFGYLSSLKLPQFFDPSRVEQARARVESASGLALVVGCGAALLAPDGLLVYADLARWEAQLRFRRDESSNLGVENHTLKASLQYKRAFFVDWRVADRWKRPLIARWDFVLDTHAAGEPKMARGETVRRGMRHTVTRPFRVVPFFDPAPWGGQWMKEVCGLDHDSSNYGWCFDCVPEENSLLLDFGGTRMELPSINLVFDQPRALLGDEVHTRFGAEFPIRFDFLDTMGGGNLSFQVHPLTEYIRRHFGMAYTQDESYYMLDAGPGACVYLGLREKRRSGTDGGPTSKRPQDCGPTLPDGRLCLSVAGAQARSFLDPRRHRPTAPARNPWSWKSARPRTFSRSSCGIGVGWGLDGFAAPDSSRSRSGEYPVGPHGQMGAIAPDQPL